ncbi:MAG: hypothetical protein KR126chlam3_01528 [Chlamydiae bacterium]|nr:hypothetical protein [Chlamydiota bacterium]
MQQTLEALPIAPEQISTCFTFINDWEQQLLSVAQREGAFQVKTAEQEQLLSHRNPSVGDYYEALWSRISDTILACKTMHSEMVRKDFKNHFDTTNQVITAVSKGAEMTGGLLGHEIPGLGVFTQVINGVFNFLSGPAKQRAVQNLSQLVREIGNIDGLSEAVARHLTKGKLRQLEQMKDSSPTSLRERLKKRWETFRANEYTTEAKQLAIYDANLIIKAVACDTRGSYKEPNLIEKLVNCVLAGSQQSPEAFVIPTPVPVSSASRVSNVSDYQRMSHRIQATNTQVEKIYQSLGEVDAEIAKNRKSRVAFAPEEKHQLLEKIKKLEDQVQQNVRLIQAQGKELAKKEDKIDEVSGGGSQAQAQVSPHSREKGAREGVAELERNMAELYQGLMGAHQNIVHLASALGETLPTDRAFSGEDPWREELMEMEGEESLL